MKNSGDYLFVYGTLRKPVGHPRYQLLERSAHYLGEGIFQGKLFMVKEFPGAVESKNPGDRVKGGLYRLSDPEKIFKKLDRYEGYQPENRTESLFIRSKQVVTLPEDGEEIKAWIYLYNRPTGALEQIKSGDYLVYLDPDNEPS